MTDRVYTLLKLLCTNSNTHFPHFLEISHGCRYLCLFNYFMNHYAFLVNLNSRLTIAVTRYVGNEINGLICEKERRDTLAHKTDDSSDLKFICFEFYYVGSQFYHVAIEYQKMSAEGSVINLNKRYMLCLCLSVSTGIRFIKNCIDKVELADKLLNISNQCLNFISHHTTISSLRIGDVPVKTVMLLQNFEMYMILGKFESAEKLLTEFSANISAKHCLAEHIICGNVFILFCSNSMNSYEIGCKSTRPVTIALQALLYVIDVFIVMEKSTEKLNVDCESSISELAKILLHHFRHLYQVTTKLYFLSVKLQLHFIYRFAKLTGRNF